MSTVKRLPVHIANQIAAGEVVERPSSVVKELVENALDAGASRIEIRLSRGGKRLIEVRDDGFGMSKADLELSIEPHATSKIEKQEDLECIRSLGFRGEALASIGAVSRLAITSRQRDSSEGWRIEVSFGRCGDIKPHACPTGTIVAVEDLFLKLPARAKFLKADQTEYARCMKVVHLFCASWPEVEFKVLKENRPVFVCRSDLPVKKRIEPLVGPKVLPHMVEVEKKGNGLGLYGFVARPEAVRLSSRNFYFFLNRRPVSSPVLWKALNEAMKGFLVKGNHPAGVLYIEIDPLLVDVNVHPTKSEVRFERPGDLYRLVFHGIKEALETQIKGRNPESSISGAVSQPGYGKTAESISRALQSSMEFPLPWQGRDDSSLCSVRDGQGVGEGGYLDRNKDNKDRDSLGAVSALKNQTNDSFRIIGQFVHSFILFELDEELVILDQHAAHEALIFRQIREEFLLSGKLNRQNLLVPHVMDVSPKLLEDFGKAEEVLSDMGIEADVFGQDQIVVRSLPVVLSCLDKDISRLEKVIEKVLKNPFMDQGELVRDVLAPLSCSMAIKAGEALNVAQMERLVRDSLKQGVTNCPHGRPIMIRLGRDELHERFFRR